MEIDIKLIKNYYNQIKKFNEDYENNYLNFYNELNQALNYWQDNNSINFNEQIIEEKNDYNKILLDLKSLETTLKNIYEKYETIGEQINYLKENKNTLYNIFEQYLGKISNSINYINNIDLSFCPELSSQILNLKKILVDSQNKIKKVKNRTKNIISNIEKKEDEISRLLSKLDYKMINESYYNDYV